MTPPLTNSPLTAPPPPTIAPQTKTPNKITAKESPSQEEVLRVTNLKKSFQTVDGQTFAILNNLNLKAQKGETIAIMGRSGSGKSTLISIMTGLEHPTQGTVTIAGQTLTTMNERALTEFRAQHIAIVFQQFHLISHLNALENVALPLQLTGLRKNVKQRAADALAQVDLTHRASQLPNKLSGGEQQRLAIARSLVVEPTVLLADEPTGNLDQETSEQVISRLFNIVKNHNITTIIVTHDHSLAQRCQTRYALQQGRLLQQS